jgi:hypothetical protein
MKKNDPVKVMRQIGKNGQPELVTGKIISFSGTITIDGEPTAVIQYDDNGEKYWHKTSEIQLFQNIE